MKLTDREYRVLLAECASRIAAGLATSADSENFSKGCVGLAGEILDVCGIENEAESDPSLKQP